MPHWKSLAEQAVSVVGTPCYVMSERLILEAHSQLRSLQTSVPLKHWLSLKTQPLAQLVRAARGIGMGIDVVSEYELAAVLGMGIPENLILVNGVGKHHWLTRCRNRELTVHFDSAEECRALAAQAKSLHWRVGLRCAIPDMHSKPGNGVPEWNQFGMAPDEVRASVALLGREGVAVMGLHFHLHSAVSGADEYRDALKWVAEVAASARIEPSYIDVGGGLPIPGEASADGLSAAASFDLGEFRALLASVPSFLPAAREVWLENGRFLSGRAGALVVTVTDRKVRGDHIYLICDGGRVNHARVAAFERHDILMAPSRTGTLVKTFVCGPTCGAVDRLGCWMLPDSVQPGDRVIWLNAGAYHMPLETRFSAGMAPIVWFDQRDMASVVRKPEGVETWWENWGRFHDDLASLAARVKARWRRRQ